MRKNRIVSIVLNKNVFDPKAKTVYICRQSYEIIGSLANNRVGCIARPNTVAVLAHIGEYCGPAVVRRFLAIFAA